MLISHEIDVLIPPELSKVSENPLINGLAEFGIILRVLAKMGRRFTGDGVIKVFCDHSITKKMSMLLIPLLKDIVCARPRIRLGCLVDPPEILYQSHYGHSIQVDQNKTEDIVVLMSKGLDSLALFNILKFEKFNIHRIGVKESNSVDDGLSEIDDNFLTINVPHFTYIDSFDNDPWDDYGRYVYFLALAAAYAYKYKIKNIALGLNKEDLQGYDLIAGVKIDSQVCQSIRTIDILTDIFLTEFGLRLLIPLKNLNKIQVVQHLVFNNINIQSSISCVFYNDKGIECGSCFSCYEKTMVLLAIFDPKNTDILCEENKFMIFHKKDKIFEMLLRKNLSNFEQLPLDCTAKILLERLKNGENETIILQSKFSVIHTLSALYRWENYLDKLTVVLPETTKYFLRNYKSLIDRSKKILF